MGPYTVIISPGMTTSAENGGMEWNLQVDGCLMGGQGGTTGLWMAGPGFVGWFK